jgi:hypothetical protein
MDKILQGDLGDELAQDKDEKGEANTVSSLWRQLMLGRSSSSWTCQILVPLICAFQSFFREQC